MPKSKRRRSQEGPMPAAGAGLIRFFADQSEGVKIGPVAVVVLSVGLLIFVMLAQFHFFQIFGLP